MLRSPTLLIVLPATESTSINDWSLKALRGLWKKLQSNHESSFVRHSPVFLRFDLFARNGAVGRSHETKWTYESFHQRAVAKQQELWFPHKVISLTCKSRNCSSLSKIHISDLQVYYFCELLSLFVHPKIRNLNHGLSIFLKELHSSCLWLNSRGINMRRIQVLFSFELFVSSLVRKWSSCSSLLWFSPLTSRPTA